MREIQKLNQQYLRILVQVENETGETRYCKRILQKNNIKELLQINRRYIDGEVFYYYAVERLHSMEEVFEDAHFSKDEMESFVQCLNEALVGIKEFLLEPEQLYLNPTYIMYDGAQRRWRFLYLLEPYQEQGQDLVDLMDFFLSKLGSDVEKESWFYEYYTDVLQFGENISPAELVRMWKPHGEELEQENEEKAREDADCISQPLIQQEVVAFTESSETTWKERLNQICYARLYLVPFCPAH